MDCGNTAAVAAAAAAVAAARSLDHQLQQQLLPVDDNDKSPNSIGSHTSASAVSSSSTTSSPPQYSEDVRRTVAALDLLPRQGSASSTKTCEVDLGEEERDTFSPISSSNNSPSDDADCDSSGGVAIAAVGLIGLSDGICNGNVNGGGGGGASSSSRTIDNKICDNSSLCPPIKRKLSNGQSTTLHNTTKEEKQRQNQEIVIMETSSISSETGSWESVFPHNPAVPQSAPPAADAAAATSDLHGCCTDFLQNERKILPQSKQKDKAEMFKDELIDTDTAPFLRERTYSTGANVTANTSSLFTGESTTAFFRELDKRENALTSSGTSACFIDASSLRDEDEVLSFPSLDGQCNSNDLLADNENETLVENSLAKETIGVDRHEHESPTKKLETFHKSFAKCKTKSKDLLELAVKVDNSESSSSSNSGADSPHKGFSAASASSTNNLSDEEKLWKREHDTQSTPEVKNCCKKDDQQAVLSTHEDATEASVSLAADLDSSDSSDIVKLRREQGRKQPPYVFQHSMQQFSIHPLGASPKFAPHCVAQPSTTTTTLPNVAHAAHSDLSYTTDYSSSSPAPSLVWSEHEHRPSATNRLHLDDYEAHPQKPSLLPDTPHNSIVHIEPNSSNTSSIHRDYNLSSSLSQQRDSGAYCSDATDSPIPMPRTPRRSKFDEANPIVSGGASIKDFHIKQCESPPIQRRTETCPIVSGGFVSLDFESACPLDDEDDEDVEMRSKPKTRKPLSGIASWVVDMSDCKPERRRSTSSSSSIETAPTGRFRERSDSTSSYKSGCGFYIPIDDTEKHSTEDPNVKSLKQQPMSQSYSAPKHTGFYVNLSKSDYQAKEAEATKVKPEEDNDKRNLFSMFVDFDTKKIGARREPLNLALRLTSSLTSSQRRAEEAMKSSASSTETLLAKSSTNHKATAEIDSGGESKSLDYKCNTEAPITVAAIRRISRQQRAESEAAKRHSWSNNQTKEGPTHDYKRSISLTANGTSKDGGNNCGLMSIIDKIPIIAKASSLSVDSSLSPYDEITISRSDLSTGSNSARNSMSGGEREDAAANANNANNTTRTKRRRRDVQINETFDKSSVASLTDGVLSKDLSPASTTDTDDLTFQQDEELALREAALQQQLPPQLPPQIPSNRTSAIIMETIVEAKETSSPKKNASGHTMESLHATIEKQKMLLETVNEHSEAAKSSFVKLSDMDNPVKFELNSPETVMSKSVGNRQINRLFRDESKARPHSWTMTRSTGNSFLNITNSVENMRSLSRLFPNFSKEFSNSLPNDIVLDQMDYVHTDLSADSSLASSFSRSGMDESSISCRQPRRLGEDLLKMFLQEIATDMIVEVHGRRIKAHKCILRSRCQYFAAMLAGHGAQSVVSLQGYSYSAVHFALCHIYSGASHPPDGISLMELAALADLLGLEGLKEVTAHALKTNYCHNFHKPCSGCIDGILQVLPVALNHALDDLYRKCLRWTCRHYLKVWPTRQFAQLPPDILGRCKLQIVAYLSSETVLTTVLDCDDMLSQLAAYRWGGICENLLRDILDAAYAYVADHFASLVASDAFLSLGHDRSCHIPRLEGVLLRTASSLTPDQACRSYQRVTRLNTVLQAKIIQMPANLGDLAKELQGLQEEDLDWDTDYIRLVSALLSAVEQCLIRQCSRAMRVTAWQRMDLELRKKIQTLARLTEPMDLKRNKTVSKAFSFGGNTRNQDLYQVKLAIQAHSKRTLAQDTQLFKATQTQDSANVQTTERGVQANNDLKEGNSKLLKSNSRAHVPSVLKATSQSTTVSERNSINMHRRTQSETPHTRTNKNLASSQKPQEAKPEPAKPKALPRLTDIRPRYLEPRKSRVEGNSSGPVRSATSSSIPATKGRAHRISSSDSSRNSSPAARRNAVNTAKIGTKSTNMSLDSLASPARRGKNAHASRGKSSDNDRFSDAGVDSLADSMKSSVITNKTISQESLQSATKLTRSNPLLGINKKTAIERQTQSTNMNGNSNVKLSRAKALGARPPKYLQQQNITSTGSSPSSVNTAKSATSRLSSVSSTHSSRDLFKQRSISMPGQDQSLQRRSFLSAKSREILAKRAEKNKQQQLLQQANNSSGDEIIHAANHNTTAPPMRSASHSAIPAAMNRNSLPSSIPMRRPNTLQLKKTNGYNKSTGGVATTAVTNGKNKIANAATNGILKAAHAVKQKIELLIDTSSATEPLYVESKLERSSTFCKESSDLDLNALQIIE